MTVPGPYSREEKWVFPEKMVTFARLYGKNIFNAMNISYNWLKRYLATDLPAERIAEILTDIGLEVEGFEKIETIRGGLQGVVVGEVLTCTDHPDSDHLHITTVGVGAAEPLQIVCGAPNCQIGRASCRERV